MKITFLKTVLSLSVLFITTISFAQVSSKTSAGFTLFSQGGIAAERNLVKNVRSAYDPVHIPAFSGDSLQFHVAASGDDLSYQWMMGSSSLVDAGPFSGTTSPTLTIHPVNENYSDQDYYVVIYRSGIACDTSALLRLKVSQDSFMNNYYGQPE